MSDVNKLQKELEEALGKSGHRMKIEGAKAIIKAVNVIGKDYNHNIHNIYNYAFQKYGNNENKVAEEIWANLTQRKKFFWMGEKKAAIFLRDIVGFDVWNIPLNSIPPPIDVRVRRVLERLQLVKKSQ